MDSEQSKKTLSLNKNKTDKLSLHVTEDNNASGMANEDRQVWKILIVDDEEDIHLVTQLALDDFIFEDKQIRMFHAYSAAEAKEMMHQHTDIALILLDVVMETSQAGLDLIQYIRNDLNNKLVRIVLRTGQPGQAPEREVVEKYQIDDYKTKTELSKDKLYSVVLVSIRTFDAMITVESYRKYFENRVKERTQDLEDLNQQLRQEIQERKQVEERLRKLHRAVYQSPSSIVITGLNGAIEYVNPAFCTTTGYTYEEAIGNNPRLLKSGKHPQKFYQNMWKTLINGQIWRGELVNRKKNGDLYWENAVISPVRDAKETITHYLAIKEDITKRKIAEKQLRKTNRKLAETVASLKELNNEKNEIFGIVSHDLKNPLTAILGNVQMARMDIASPDDIKIVLDNIERSGQRMFEMVTNLLDINRIESGKINLTFEIFNVVFILSQTVTNYVSRALEKEIRIIFDPPDTEIDVYADINALRQVFDNLISNAVKFTPPGKCVYVEIHENETQIQCRVRDEGQGLTQEDMKKLFKKFTRLSARPTGNEHSTGLGLSIVKKLVEAMQGSVWAESDGKDQGSTFIIELPRQNNS